MTPNPLTLASSNQSAPFISPQAPTTQFRALVVPASLTRIQTATSPKFDRVVFTFSGKNVPGYWFLAKNAAAPGSTAVFEMRFGARSTNKPALKKSETLNFPVLKGFVESKAGEESVVLQATLSKASPYRVTELSKPPRIVVDFEH